MTITVLPTTLPAGTSSSSAREVRTEQLFAEAVEVGGERETELRNAAAELNLSLAAGVARRYAGRGIDAEDLEQVARFALVKAARRYRPGVGSGFGAFAVPTMMGEVKRYFRDQGSPVRPPRHLQELRLLVATTEQALEQQLGRQPLPDEIAVDCGVTIEEVRDAQDARGRYHCLSLDLPIGDGREGTVGDGLPDPQDRYAEIETRDALRRALVGLRHRDRVVVRLRFEDGLTQTEIGKRVGVSQMQVSRILSDITHRLREELVDPRADRSA